MITLLAVPRVSTCMGLLVAAGWLAGCCGARGVTVPPWVEDGSSLDFPVTISLRGCPSQERQRITAGVQRQLDRLHAAALAGEIEAETYNQLREEAMKLYLDLASAPLNSEALPPSDARAVDARWREAAALLDRLERAGR